MIAKEPLSDMQIVACCKKRSEGGQEQEVRPVHVPCTAVTREHGKQGVIPLFTPQQILEQGWIYGSSWGPLNLIILIPGCVWETSTRFCMS